MERDESPLELSHGSDYQSLSDRGTASQRSQTCPAQVLQCYKLQVTSYQVISVKDNHSVKT